MCDTDLDNSMLTKRILHIVTLILSFLFLLPKGTILKR